MTPGAQFKRCPRCQAGHPLDAKTCACGHTFRTQFVQPTPPTPNPGGTPTPQGYGQPQSGYIPPGQPAHGYGQPAPNYAPPGQPHPGYGQPAPGYVPPGQTQYGYAQPQAGPQQPNLQPQQIQCPACRTVYASYVPRCQCGHSFEGQHGVQNGQTMFWQTTYVQQDSTRLIITILLLVFLGQLGAHRFYLGYHREAVWMLILSLIGIATACILIGYFFLIATMLWAYYDLYLILTRQLRPADGTPLF